MNTNQKVDYPLVVFFAIFVVILLGLYPKLATQKNESQGRQLPTAGAVSRKDNSQKLKGLDYNKPIECGIMGSTSSLSAQLDGSAFSGSILSQGTTKRMILEGDCFYLWNLNENKGKKQCKVGSSLGMVKQLLTSGLITPDIIATLTKQMGKTPPADMDKLFKSCKNVERVERNGFVIPKSVQFFEEAIQ